MDEIKRQRLIKLINEHAVRRGEFVLASGQRASYYIDGKQVTLSAEGAALAADLILEVISEDAADAVGGPTIGADPIAGAVAAASSDSGSPCRPSSYARISRSTVPSDGLRDRCSLAHELYSSRTL